MAKKISKLVKLAEKLAAKAEQRVRRELGALAKSGIISRAEAKQILKAAAREAAREEKRVRAFIISELKRELRKAKPKAKKLFAKKRKQFESYRKKRK